MSRARDTITHPIATRRYDVVTRGLRVIVPFTWLRDETLDALCRYAKCFELVDVSGSPTAYADLLAQCWHDGTSFLVIEHDIVIDPATIPALAACTAPWCVRPYYRHELGHGPLMGSLGCVRFTRALLLAAPDIPILADDYDGGLPPRHWGNRDDAYRTALERRGYRPHVHLPTLAHVR